MKINARERAHIRNFIKLCYILVILSALCVLKSLLYPESYYELFVVPLQIPLILECIVSSLIILVSGNWLLERTL